MKRLSVVKKKISIPRLKAKLPKVRKQVVKLSEKTIEKSIEANQMFSNLADFFLFIFHTTRELFSRRFEFREFLLAMLSDWQQVAPLISVTGHHHWSGAHNSVATCSG
jgi:hypothetical protein